MKCRHCAAELTLPLIDLGSAPPSNAYLTPEALHIPEKWYPLRVLVCTECWLAQTEDYAGASELFTPDYAYFSSFSSTWLAHAERYVAAMSERFALGSSSTVVEIAANDGYLLQYVKARGISCLGVEPTASTAAAARKKGIEIVEEFFGVDLAEKLVMAGKQADLIAANNVVAHVPDINDFLRGFTVLLKPAGVATIEFTHLLRIVEDNQFDTIYHEHFSYLSATAAVRVFDSNGLTVFDVEEIPTHGGSLRVYAQRSDSGTRPRTARLEALLKRESDAGMLTPGYYVRFQDRARGAKNEFVEFLLQAWKMGKSVAAYGAAAKGNTLLNYAGIRTDLIPFVVDRNPAKVGKYMPGSRIPIVTESRLDSVKPDYVIVFPWNLRAEIVDQLAYVRGWGGQFVIAIPRLGIVQ